MIMRTLALIMIAMCSSAFAVEDTTTNQDNTSIASPSSTMSNVQVNTGSLARSTFGGGVGCDVATLSVSATKTPSFGEYYTATYTVPVTAMFKTSDCEKAARTQNQISSQYLTDMKYATKRLNETHDRDMAKADAVIAKLCVGLHGAVSMDPHATMFAMCKKYAPLLDKHHNLGEMNISLMPDHHKRVSPTKVSWGE